VEALKPKVALHKKATFTFPPEIIAAIDERWRFHKMVDSSYAASKSAYLADLVRRDMAKKITVR
jgi:hypothetical protein